MKRALVLCGGGSRGAYEVGAYQALVEAGYTFDIIVGTSIGALNGALIAQGEFEFLKDLWKNMDITQVVNYLPDMSFSLDNIMANKTKITSFLKSYVKDFGADTAPLQNLVRTKADANKIRENNITYGCVCTSYPSLHGVEITLDEMEEGTFPDYLLATSACFPAFPVQTILGKEYIDGGYYDNTPIQFALRLGAEELVVVDLNYPKIDHPEYEYQPNILTIRPTQDIGIMFNFNNDHLQRIRQIGYLDTLRALQLRKGTYYTFIPNTNKELVKEITKTLALKLQHADIINPSKKVLSIKSKSPFTDAMNNLVKYTNDEDYILALLEKCAKYFNIDSLQEYTIEEMIQILLEPYQTLDIYDIKEYLPTLVSKLTTIKDELSNIDMRFLFGILLHKITNKQEQDLLPLLPFIGDQIACAFFVSTLYTKIRG